LIEIINREKIRENIRELKKKFSYRIFRNYFLEKKNKIVGGQRSFLMVFFSQPKNYRDI